MDSIDEIEFPLYEAMLHCDCGYKSRGFSFKEHAYACVACAEVVFPEPLPFLYVPPSCNQCGTQLGREHRIHTSRMMEGSPERCPRCLRSTLQLQDNHMQLLINDCGDMTPLDGQLLHARIRQPKNDYEPLGFFSPRLRMKLAMNVTIENTPREVIGDGYHEFIASRVDNEELVVRHLRKLNVDEWRWFHG